MKELWSDKISNGLKSEWIEGSYCDRLLKDIKALKNRNLIDKEKCKGCKYAPYDKNFGRCRTCIKHTKHEREDLFTLQEIVDNQTALSAISQEYKELANNFFDESEHSAVSLRKEILQDKLEDEEAIEEKIKKFLSSRNC